MGFFDILETRKGELIAAACNLVLKTSGTVKRMGIDTSALRKGYPACSVWGYKDESVNGTHDGTYTEETRRDSKCHPNWRVVRVVYGARLESVCIRKGAIGSNPILSAHSRFA
jgi:hypothetical protein